MDKQVFLFFSKKSKFNLYILQIIQIYNIEDIKGIDYDYLKSTGKVNMVPKEITAIPGIAVYKNDKLIIVCNGPDVFTFINNYYRLKIESPSSIKNSDKTISEREKQTYHSSIHSEIKRSSTSPIIDKTVSKMIPKVEQFKFKYYSDGKNQKDNYVLNGSVQANQYAKIDPKNQKFYSRPDKSIITDIKNLPRNPKTGQPIIQESKI